jgi:hypothetical protein
MPMAGKLLLVLQLAGSSPLLIGRPADDGLVPGETASCKGFWQYETLGALAQLRGWRWRSEH